MTKAETPRMRDNMSCSRVSLFLGVKISSREQFCFPSFGANILSVLLSVLDTDIDYLDDRCMSRDVILAPV